MRRLSTLEPYARPRAIDRLLPHMLRSPRARAAVAVLPQGSRLRRQVIVRLIVWAYRELNETGQMPTAVFTPDIVMNQTAALLGTAGRYEGRERVREIISELHDTFEVIRFEPEQMLEVSPERLLLAVRFSGTGKASSLPMESVIAHVITLDLEWGGVSGLDVYWEMPEAMAAVGLEA